jgi:hypothetical protein
MSSNSESSQSNPKDVWRELAVSAISAPGIPSECPICYAKPIHVSWRLSNLKSAEITMALSCSSCNATRSLKLLLPKDISLPISQMQTAEFVAQIRKEIEAAIESIKLQLDRMPALAFTTNSLWTEARWAATTFRWHPKSEAPPIMGIVFENAEAGKRLFREFSSATNQKDEFEELCISIIEGIVPGQPSGYTVHLYPDPDGLAARATAEDFVINRTIIPFLGRWNRMYPIPGATALLAEFKKEFAKHGQFMLAPAVRRADGQLWFEPDIGVVKTVIHFRNLSEITSDDPDAAALVLPQLITPA